MFLEFLPARSRVPHMILRGHSDQFLGLKETLEMSHLPDAHENEDYGLP